MVIKTETARLILREIEQTDENDLFEMDSDPAVHYYIEQKPLANIGQIRPVITMLQQQYKDYGIARWAVVDKKTSECLGWAGLKYFTETVNNHTGFYELGYRLKQKHWGKGYATEASVTVIDYGFRNFRISSIYAMTDTRHMVSQKVLKKLQFDHVCVFDYDGDSTDWFELKKSDWEAAY